MSLEQDFPVFTGAQEAKRRTEKEKELQNKGESFFERILRGGKKVAIPAIAGLIAIGSVKEGKAQSKSENIKRVVSMDQVMNSEGNVAFQENDSTVHMYNVHKKGNGTVKMKDLGTIITKKGDAVKVNDLKQNPDLNIQKKDTIGGIIYYYPNNKKSDIFLTLKEAQSDAKKRGLSTNPNLFYSTKDAPEANNQKEIKKDGNEKSVGSGPFWFQDKKGIKHRFSNFLSTREERDKENPHALITKD